MKKEQYDSIFPKLDSIDAVSDLADNFSEDTSYNTLVSIYNQKVTAEMKLRGNELSRDRKRRDRCVERYRTFLLQLWSNIRALISFSVKMQVLGSRYLQWQGSKRVLHVSLRVFFWIVY
jgi:hypothetical protein